MLPSSGMRSSAAPVAPMTDVLRIHEYEYVANLRKQCDQLAAAGETKAAQAYAGTRMNTAFQIATFTSVVAGVAVSSLNILQPPKAGGGASGGGSTA